MMFFLIISLCAALKLSDPSSLRDVTEENISLQAWCASTGCVMPFTPKSCQSWCDWNVDKQADAEARGAFGGIQWGAGKQVKADSFWIGIGQTDAGCDVGADALAGNKFYFQGTDKNDVEIKLGSGAATAIFPGGDEERKLSQTSLKCGVCYKIARDGSLSTTGPAGTSRGLPKYMYVKFSYSTRGPVAGGDYSSVMTLYAGTNVGGGIANAETKCNPADVLNSDHLSVVPYWRGELPKILAARQTTKTRDADGKAIVSVPLKCVLSLSDGTVGSIRGVNGDNVGNDWWDYHVQFSGTAHGGVSQPTSCPES